MNLHELASASREAFYLLNETPVEKRNEALIRMARQLEVDQNLIFEANREDVCKAEKERLAAPLLQRLKFGKEKLSQVVRGLEALAALPDPIGKTTLARELTDGLKLYRVTCPIGVLGIIFESRPDALVQIASLALKSGNTVLLKGGREALKTNQILCDCLRKAVSDVELPGDFAFLLESREDVTAMLKEDSLIDLIIPRGSREFVRYIMDNSRIPVLGHADGLCHVYVDRDADLSMAINVASDSKVQNVSVCNAMETLLVHEEIAEAFLPSFAEKMLAEKVRLLGDQKTVELTGCEPAADEDWQTEYLDRILSIKVVRNVDEAIAHINHYGSHHTDCIVTENPDTAKRFRTKVDSAGVYQNVSTRFADGFVYGFGAEVGIATGKLHARGPMGLEGLTTYKYELIGCGQTMAEMKDGRRAFTHRLLNEEAP